MIAEVQRLAADERHATARLIACLAEVDARRLYLGQGCSSLFTYCTQVLRLSEHAAYHRIEAARAARRFPVVLELLAQGAITLTNIGLLASHLTTGNHRAVLDAARLKTKREVEHLVATMRPQPAISSTVRKLPVAKPTAAESVGPHAPARAAAECDGSILVEPPASQASRRAVVAPLAPERYKLQCTLSRETYEKLRRAQDLLRHTIPDGEPAAIVDRALTLLVASLEKQKLAATDRPRAPRKPTTRSRHIPASVKRAVWTRDGGRCTFAGPTGRCRETGLLEFHHVVPFAEGGESTTANIELRCRAHNSYEAEMACGSFLMRESVAVFETTRSGPSVIA